MIVCGSTISVPRIQSPQCGTWRRHSASPISLRPSITSAVAANVVGRERLIAEDVVGMEMREVDARDILAGQFAGEGSELFAEALRRAGIDDDRAVGAIENVMLAMAPPFSKVIASCAPASIQMPSSSFCGRQRIGERRGLRGKHREVVARGRAGQR